MRGLVGAVVCGLYMFIGWSAVFPGVLMELDADLKTRLFIFMVSFILDAIFISLMLDDFAEYDRLRNNIARISNQNHGSA